MDLFQRKQHLKIKMEKKNNRNWCLKERNPFCSILVDPATNFMAEIEKALEEEPFKSSKFREAKRKLELNVKKPQVKYSNIKQQWRKLTDRKKNGSGLGALDDPEWFQIINPV